MIKAFLLSITLLAVSGLAVADEVKLSYIFTSPSHHLVVLQNAEATKNLPVKQLCEMSKKLELSAPAQITHVLANDGQYINCK